jgi:hypothetical protein
MIHPAHLRRVIRETLAAMGERYAAPAAVELLMLTAGHEGRAPGDHAALWQHRDGLPKGPAIGIYQMEPGRYNDTMERAPESLLAALARIVGPTLGVISAKVMCSDLAFATAMARAAYWLIPEKLPAADDVEGLAGYWHRHWCRGCRGTVKQAVKHYLEYAKP